MPELPEVRTVTKILKNNLINKKITNYKILYPKVIDSDSLDLNLLVNQTLRDIKTYGKYIVFDFDKYKMVSHLRMEGKYFLKEIDDPINKHELFIIEFNNISLRYHDTRRFGRIQLVETKNLNKVSGLSKLALEPFEITKEEIYEKLKKKSMPIKSILLDQTIIAGLGNIYVDEVLFATGIHPLRLGKNISIEECQKIIDSSIEILNKSIEEGGTTIMSYTSSLGVTGNYQNYLKVHKTKSKECSICNSKIERIKVGGRGTYFCPHCQK